MRLMRDTLQIGLKRDQVNTTRHDSYLALIEKHAERANTALAQCKDLAASLLRITERLELSELQQADLSKKLEIVEQIILLPDDDKLTLSGVNHKVAEVRNELQLLKDAKLG